MQASQDIANTPNLTSLRAEDVMPLPVFSTVSGRAGTAEESHDEPYDPVQGERAVWRAVIVQALMDASCQSAKKESQQAREESLVWLRGRSPDFATVCYFAGFEPDYVRRMVRSCLERNCAWRAAPGSGAPRKRRMRDGQTKRAPNQRR
jgi:hypothetical protein